MRQQNWEVGGRYMMPTRELLKSGSSASSLSDFKNHIKDGGEIIMATSINLNKEAAVINTKLNINLNNHEYKSNYPCFVRCSRSFHGIHLR